VIGIYKIGENMKPIKTGIAPRATGKGALEKFSTNVSLNMVRLSEGLYLVFSLSEHGAGSKTPLYFRLENLKIKWSYFLEKKEFKVGNYTLRVMPPKKKSTE
jgi:hypothetical protein